MRTNIDIDDDLMEGAMRAGHFKTKKDAVEAGLALLARQAAYREILKWEGKLQWEGDAQADVNEGAQVIRSYPAAPAPQVLLAREPSPAAKPARTRKTAAAPAPVAAPAKKTHGRR